MQPNIPVSDIMTNNLVTVTPETFVARIMGLFEQHNFHHLPVTKNGNELVGIISKEDIQKVANLLALNIEDDTLPFAVSDSLTARDIMTHYPFSLDPEDTIGLAADIVLGNRFHAIPVIEDGQLVGLVTSHDLIAYAFNSPVKPKTEQFVSPTQ